MMDVDDFSGKFVTETRGKNLHEAGEHDELDILSDE